jgi:hypothetical protein
MVSSYAATKDAPGERGLARHVLLFLFKQKNVSSVNYCFKNPS